MAAAARPVLTVFKTDGSKAGQVATPGIFLAPIRSDVVHFVHTNMNKNSRQPYAVSKTAGMMHSAESWGTGRALARIPRVSGSGTNRNGQGAFGNMCRKGRMASPTKIWRKWHRKTNLTQKRFAVASALAASALPALVMARGHSIGKLNEVPLVLDNSFESLTKTKDAVKALKAVGAGSDLARCVHSRKAVSGRARLRSKGHTVARGPLVIIKADTGISRAVRNLPGVECANVKSLNLLQLAPGGTLGRFIVWTQGAVEELAKLPVPTGNMTSADINRIMTSEEVYAQLRPARRSSKAPVRHNPLVNKGARTVLNPYAATLRKLEREKHAKNFAAKQAAAKK